MRAVAPASPATDDLDGSRLVLRDGTAASVRVAGPDDRDAIRRFFHRLPAEQRYQRFMTAADPSDTVIDRDCGPMPSAQAQTLLASRTDPDGVSQIVAVANYVAVNAATAEVAFAVALPWQGLGISTLLLERLAALAARDGFEQFVATTLADNMAMLNVFRESGFQVKSSRSSGCVDVELTLTLDREGVAASEARRMHATVESMTRLLRPRAVAVVGASRDAQKVGSRILTALQAGGFRGALYAVHPRLTDILGVSAYRSARDLPTGVDLAVISVPAASVPAVVDDCAHAGVRTVVVITAGFAESGRAGAVAQTALVERVRGYGMRMVGPNCMGIVNLDPAVRLNASFAPAIPPAGSVALASQSGAVGIAVLDLASDRDVGLSSFVSLGNKGDISGNDLLEYWEQDASTRVVLLYLESFGNGRRFARIARRVSRTKPIVAIKAGRTQAGIRAAGSHTAALASNDAAVTALFQQTGVIRVDTIDDMFDVATCLDLQPLPQGNRVAIVTNAGGPGILAADACEVAGLRIAAFGPATQATLASVLPGGASCANPVDMVAAAGPAEYRATLDAVIADPNVDAVVAIYTPVDTVRPADVLASIGAAVAAARKAGIASKPVLVCAMTKRRRAAPLQAGDERLPSYMFPENAVRALARVAQYAAWRAAPEGQVWDCDDIRVDEARAICRRALEQRGPGWLTSDETWRLLRAFNLPALGTAIAESADEAVALAELYGYPAVAKMLPRQGQHKSEIGGVRVGLRSPLEVRAAFEDLSAAARRLSPAAVDPGVAIQPMVTGGVETLVGMVRDPAFGPLVAFGSGGVDVELFGDIRFRLSPLTDRDVDQMIGETKAVRLLRGFRGAPEADVRALRDVVSRVSRLADTVPEIAELDLNPVSVLPNEQGCRIMDARVRVEQSSDPANHHP